MKKELQRVVNANWRMEEGVSKKRPKMKMSRKGQNFRVVERYSAGRFHKWGGTRGLIKIRRISTCLVDLSLSFPSQVLASIKEGRRLKLLKKKSRCRVVLVGCLFC